MSAGDGRLFVAEGSRLQMKRMAVQDNGGRRSGVDRRQFNYAVHIPERREGKDRRSGHDRRRPRHISFSQAPPDGS